MTSRSKKPPATTAELFSFASVRPWPERGSEDLTPDHQQYLADRGIKRPYWLRANYRSEPDGLIIPYPNIKGGFLSDFGRKRLIPERVASDGKKTKFTQPGKKTGIDVNRLYFAPLAATKLDWPTISVDPTIETYIIEGETHAAAVAQYGTAAIGIGGAWNWAHRDEDDKSVLVPDFDLINWRDRSVVLAYDADIETKPKIQLAALRLSSLLTERGAVVKIVLIPDLGDGKSGVDDFVVDGC